MAMGFGGMNLLSGTPMFGGGGLMGTGMFGARPLPFPSSPPGFVGASNPRGGMSAAEYYANEQERQAEQMRQALARRAMKADQDNTNRELSLKEVLANHQMNQDQAATGLARDRLGLDWNTASADAANRRNALSLQERLGWAGENRMSASDAAEQALKQQQIDAQRDQFHQSFNNLSAGQQSDRELALQQLAQQKQLAQMPYAMQTADQRAQDALSRAQMSQQDRQFNSQFSQVPLSDRMRLGLQERGMMLPYERMTQAEQGQQGLDQQRLKLSERLGLLPYQQMTASDAARLAQDQRQFEGVSGSERLRDNRAGKEMTLREMLEKARLAQDQKQFEGVSGNNQAQLQSQREMFDIGQNYDYARHWDNKEQANLDRASREKTAQLGVMGDMLRGTAVDPEMAQSLADRLFGVLGVPNSPLADPQARMERSMLNAQRSASRKAVLGSDREPLNPEEQLRVNQHYANAIDEGRAKGWYTDAGIDSATGKDNRDTVRGSKTVNELLKAAEKERLAIEEARQQSNPLSPKYRSSFQRGTGWAK